MLKSAMQFIVDSAKVAEINYDGKRYTTKQLYPVKEVLPETLGVHSLTGLVDYINSNIDHLAKDKAFVLIQDHGTVSLHKYLTPDFNQRATLLTANLMLRKHHFDNWVDSETFNIWLQSGFVETDNKAAVLKVVGNIRSEVVAGVSDDGVSQEVTAKAGIATVAKVIVPNPVLLRPFRTFAEVEQPESPFILRLRTGAECKLVEADGGAWRNTARLNIKTYLETHIKDMPILA